MPDGFQAKKVFVTAQRKARARVGNALAAEVAKVCARDIISPALRARGPTHGAHGDTCVCLRPVRHD